MAGAVIPEPRTRDRAVDVARGIAIVLVVVGHNHALSSSAPAFIDALFLFHVPLFFLLSGLVQREQSLAGAALNLATRLLLPFLLAALLVGTAKVIARGESFADLLFGMVWATGQTLPWSHLWFLPALFLTLFLTQLLRRVPGGAARWLVAASLAFGSVLILPAVTGPDLGARGFPAPAGWPWSVDLMPQCLLFVWIGALLHDSPRARALAVSPWAAAVAAPLFLFALGARVDLNMRIFTPPALAVLAATSGCVLALALARALSRLRGAATLLATIGRHTLSIFLLHVSIQKVLLAGSTSWIAGTLTAVAAIAMSMAIGIAASAVARHARASTPRSREVAT